MSNDVGERQRESSECINWLELLRLEKRRRGVPEDKLVFVGASEAQFWWCAQQSLLRVRDYELGVFANYVFESARVITPNLDKEMAKMLIYGLMQMGGGRGLRLLEFVDRFYKKRAPDEVLKSVVERTAGGCRENNRTLIRRDDKLIVLGEEGK